ncbi:TetR/AcrR family transcriptional regulator [Streptosporangium sp. 'caverna']|uniref:TetR/AcrR family transcriptional regulator n=1 Tax=Streptosporangium sp. 'caverna' TaxID=2202249 RepID=UPI000D7D8466|nr:TetR/AcrR family transcriptional regulator [Streptosporangium sp. 'caverna']AWS48867.1 TetR family transcriptional regulator [Streptosporangium sp. 'caverna']
MSENTEGELPRTLEVLWGRSRQRTRGPAQALSLERIVATAIDLADADGMSALSMARLAERLGCATMSLYRHVANKDELQVFMLDAAPGPPPEFGTAPADWRAALSEWALGLLGVYHRHPWILQVAVGPPMDPGQLAWMDAGLRTLGGTALHPHDRMSVVLLVMHYVRGEAQISANLLRAGADEAEAMREYGEILARLVVTERFPALAEVIAAGGLTEDADPLANFRSGLECVLDGVDVRVRAAQEASR